MIVQSVTAKVNRDKTEVRNHEGEIAAVSYYNATQTLSIIGVVAGTAITPAPGVALAMAAANIPTLYGVTTGTIRTDTVSIDGANTEFRQINIESTQYPLIPT